jgi:hypothetical protein
LMNCNAFDGIRCISHGKCKFWESRIPNIVLKKQNLVFRQ